ncbi:TetR/AcrR family transcriptional regulator [Desulfogranum marinum]|uniref:TetR/AcrR family transcriptional regulator n=1 Tax=Desulfogranum marinum TaxID=453220 RepID=UPI0019651F34|nr:TetR/AcrR family transcriptional regulator [Desulfogranum marinum]MBM9511626.1 TetR/AcrR family transcriptional regulator [Desulfogranum marinum]
MKSADKHRKIIRAATKVFAKKGFFNARISDIAKEAKVADGTIYLYFKNKFDILISVFEQEIGKLIEQITELINKENDPKVKLEIFIGKHLQEMKKNKNLAEVIHIELRQTNKLVRDYRKNSFSNYLNIVSSIIEEGKQKNIFRQDIQPDIAKQILFGALDEISRIWGSGNEMGMDFSVEDVTEQLTAIFQQGVLETDHES